MPAMAKERIETIGFRPTQWEEDAILAAEQATGRKRSELLRRCVKASLATVVRDILDNHQAAVRNFESVIAMAEGNGTSSAVETKPIKYPKHKRVAG